MWHTIFIAGHAVTGGIALLAGCVAIGRRALFGTYLWSLIAMEGSWYWRSPPNGQ